MHQQRFWKELDQLKVHVFYLELYLDKTENHDRIINMFLAIASSSSIAGWVIWQPFSFIWAAIIASSHVLNSIKQYLPYTKRLKALQSLSNELEALFIQMESDWYKVSEGELTEKEINSLQMKYKEKIRQATQKHLGTSSLPKNKKLLDESKTSAKAYLDNFYK